MSSKVETADTKYCKALVPDRAMGMGRTFPCNRRARYGSKSQFCKIHWRMMQRLGLEPQEQKP